MGQEGRQVTMSPDEIEASRKHIFTLIDLERRRQGAKHGNNSMESRRETIGSQVAVLGKQFGQVCAVAQAMIFRAEPSEKVYGQEVEALTQLLQHELVSVAAVAVAMLELLGGEGQ